MTKAQAEYLQVIKKHQKNVRDWEEGIDAVIKQLKKS